MDTQIEDAANPANGRHEIERLVARYDLDEKQLHTVLKYLKQEASAMDRALIASNAEIAPRYRLLCYDHYLDRLRPSQIVVITVLAAAFAGALIWAGMAL